MKESDKNLQARLAQLEIEIALRDEAEKALLADACKRENEILAQMTRLQRELTDLQRQTADAVQEGAERHAALLDEYRSIEALLLARGQKPSFAAVKKEFADIKALLTASQLKDCAAEVIAQEKSCWTCVQCVTDCVQCVTDCVQCVTSACVQCVVNGSGNLCSLSSLVYSPCRPKPDIGEQIGTAHYDRLEIVWREDEGEAAGTRRTKDAP
ncbi:MAG: hypothetical protein Kow0092_00680 [Deferrisomatales bacterium]